MRIPWKQWGTQAWSALVRAVQVVAPDKGQADRPEPTAEELWERWRSRKSDAGLWLVMASLAATAAPVRAQEAACVATVTAQVDTVARLQLPGAELVPTQARSRARLIEFARARCTPPSRDTVRVVVTDTLWRTITDTLYLPAPADSAPPPDSVPPRDSVPPVDSTPPVDTTPPPPPPPPLPVPQGVELPRTIPIVPAGLDTAACTVQVTGALQAALNASRDGDVLCLSGTFTGTFSLPHRATPGWVVVRSAASVAAPGERIRPSLAAPLATIRGLSVMPTLQTIGSARGWYLRELNIEADSILATVYSVVSLLRGSSDIVLDRVWVHPPADRQNQRCVTANGASITIINSWLFECHGKGFDSQAIITWDSPGPLRFENNTLGGAGENVMAGGADPTTPGLRPCDITIRRNHIWTPLTWKGTWTKKNLLELKSACRVLIEHNVLDGSWPDAQTGFAFVLKSSNQSGSCRWCGTSDVTIRRNLIVNSAAPLNISGTVPGTNPVDSMSRRMLIEENYAETGGAVGADSRHLLFTGDSRDITLRRNTWTRLTLNAGNAYTGADPGTTTGTNWVIDRDAVHFANYGVMGRWASTLSPPGTVNLQVPGLALWGSKARSGQLPNVTTFATLSAAIAAGFGIDRATIDAATRGVVVLP